MSPNNKIGAKCLTNLHLKVSDKEILEEATIEDVENEDFDEEKEEKDKEEKDQKDEKEDQKPVPTATHKEAEIFYQREQGEAVSKGEASKEEEGEALDNDVDDASSDEEVQMPVQKKPIVTPRKSGRLASKGKHPVVSLDDDSSSHTTLEPQPTTPLSQKKATSPTHHILSPPPSPIPVTPPPTTTTPTSPGLGFTGFTKSSSILAALLEPALNKLEYLQSQFYSFQDEICVTFASITDQLTQMEARLGAKLDTVKVQTEFVDEKEFAA